VTAFARAAVFVMLACAIAPSGARGDAFPVRPAHVRLLAVDGVLLSWAIGNGNGGIAIRSRDGRTRLFTVTDAIVVDGTPVRCAYAPKPGEARDPDACSFWPRNLLLGKTNVRVSYWRDSAARTASDRDVVVSLRTLS
jgi:hypothetical protein